jgi:hypothetical protein
LWQPVTYDDQRQPGQAQQYAWPGFCCAWQGRKPGGSVAIAAPGARRSLLGKAVAAHQARALARRGPSQMAKAVAVARAHVVTFASLASMDFGAFHFGAGFGWVAVGGSMLLAHFAVTG